MTIPKFRTAKVGINNENNKEELKNFSFLRRLVSHRCGNLWEHREGWTGIEVWKHRKIGTINI